MKRIYEIIYFAKQKKVVRGIHDFHIHHIPFISCLVKIIRALLSACLFNLLHSTCSAVYSEGRKSEKGKWSLDSNVKQCFDFLGPVKQSGELTHSSRPHLTNPNSKIEQLCLRLTPNSSAFLSIQTPPNQRPHLTFWLPRNPCPAVTPSRHCSFWRTTCSQHADFCKSKHAHSLIVP